MANDSIQVAQLGGLVNSVVGSGIDKLKEEALRKAKVEAVVLAFNQGDLGIKFSSEGNNIVAKLDAKQVENLNKVLLSEKGLSEAESDKITGKLKYDLDFKTGRFVIPNVDKLDLGVLKDQAKFLTSKTGGGAAFKTALETGDPEAVRAVLAGKAPAAAVAASAAVAPPAAAEQGQAASAPAAPAPATGGTKIPDNDRGLKGEQAIAGMLNGKVPFVSKDMGLNFSARIFTDENGNEMKAVLTTLSKDQAANLKTVQEALGSEGEKLFGKFKTRLMPPMPDGTALLIITNPGEVSTMEAAAFSKSGKAAIDAALAGDIAGVRQKLGISGKSSELDLGRVVAERGLQLPEGGLQLSAAMPATTGGSKAVDEALHRG